MTEELAFKAANYYAEGLSFGKIGKEMGVSKSQVGDLIREGIFSMVNGGGKGVPEEPEQPNEGMPPPGGEPFFPSPRVDATDLDDAFGKSILIQATPILRKVVLNSKVYLQHEYFQEKLGYEGDIGDLLVEALEFYWKEMGFSIRITQDSVI